MTLPRHPLYLGLLVLACLALVFWAMVDPERRYLYMFLLLLGLLGIWREFYPTEDDEEF